MVSLRVFLPLLNHKWLLGENCQTSRQMVKQIRCISSINIFISQFSIPKYSSYCSNSVHYTCALYQNDYTYQ